MMKGINLIKTNFKPWLSRIALIVSGICLAFCTNNSPVSKADYATKIVGHWQGTVGDVKETMTINSDGTFNCKIYPMGFIANTLSQKLPGSVRGTWTISGAILTLNITGEKNERLENSIASSTIVSFKEDNLVLKSDRGGTSMFHRVLSI